MTEYNIEDINRIQNSTLRYMVGEAIVEKGNTSPLISREGTPISMRIGLMGVAVSNLKSYISKLIGWAIDPDEQTTGNDGYGFALLLTHVLRTVYSDEPEIHVFQSPARLDFEPRRGGRADIVIAKQTDKFEKPIVLIEAKMGRHERIQNSNERLLNLPIITLQGDEIFGRGKDAVRYFGLDSDPAGYAARLANTFGGGLKNYIKNS